MKPEEKVPSLETCRKLRNEGWQNPTERVFESIILSNGQTHTRLRPNAGWGLPAPDISELLEALKKVRHKLTIRADGIDFSWSGAIFEATGPLPECLAELWLHIKKHHPQNLMS